MSRICVLDVYFNVQPISVSHKVSSYRLCDFQEFLSVLIFTLKHAISASAKYFHIHLVPKKCTLSVQHNSIVRFFKKKSVQEILLWSISKIWRSKSQKMVKKCTGLKIGVQLWKAMKISVESVFYGYFHGFYFSANEV